MALVCAALVASVACAPLPEETSASAPSVASSTVVLAGVELSGPVSALVPQVGWGGFLSGASVTEQLPVWIFLLDYNAGVLRLTLNADGRDESADALWCPRLSGIDSSSDPVWTKVRSARRAETGEIELAERVVLDDLDFKAEFGLPFVPYRPVAVTAIGERVAVVWREQESDIDGLHWGPAFVTLSDAGSGASVARSARVAERCREVRVHTLADMTGDGESELAVAGDLDDQEQFVVFDGHALCELSRYVVAGVRGWSSRSERNSTVIGEGHERVVLLHSGDRLGARRVDFRVNDATPNVTYQQLPHLSPAFELCTLEAFDGGSVLATFVDHCGRTLRSERDCWFAVIPELVGPTDRAAIDSPVLIGQGSRGHPNAWRIPDWDGDGRSEVLATDGIGGLLLFPSTRLSAPLHVASPDGWEVDGRSTSVVEHAGRPFVVTNAVRLAESTRWTSVMELRPRMAAPGPVRR